jgi:hypothetical protein
VRTSVERRGAPSSEDAPVLTEDALDDGGERAKSANAPCAGDGDGSGDDALDESLAVRRVLRPAGFYGAVSAAPYASNASTHQGRDVEREPAQRGYVRGLERRRRRWRVYSGGAVRLTTREHLRY